MVGIGTGLARLAMVAVPSALGVAAIVFAGDLKSLPSPSEANRPAALVRVITLAPIEMIPRVTGYGTVAPVREWRAVARIEGEIRDIAKPLAPGDIVAKDTPLFTIDDSDLKLQRASLEAQVAASKVKDDTVRTSLELARSDLALAQDELDRQKTLHDLGRITQPQLDAARRQQLTAQTKVTDLESQLKLNEAEREVLVTQAATIDRSIGLSTISAPFELRVNSLDADLGQYVNRGQVLLSGEGVAAVDISAQFPIGRMGPLLRLAGDGTKVTDLKARVTLPEPEHPIVWKAKVERMGEAIDETTQSAPVVVRVDDPLGQAQAGERPPLRRNMVVAVELAAPKQSLLVVPAEAVAGGSAMVVAEDGTLEKRAVKTSFVSGDLAVIAQGLKAGDKLVVTDPSIAVPGMTVKATEDEARRAEIAAEALGQTATSPQPGSGGGGGGGGGKGAAPEGDAAPSGDSAAKPAGDAQ
ncbi:efflux RND transporter periplasmic adaptor subunit [Thioclava sp. JE_KL1]|uniref:efflux RND transporter periplasmic adaptor subunit n=1 Tax=Thioclava sp. JE_KL1 TaxID=2651187 RepID=UPI00156211BD|nr:HlyD family efflux transporter periplasmic adaptor subunit [Thioclava sp. JE_KL1]